MTHLTEARALLAKAATQFRFYAEQHQAKLSDPALSAELKVAAHNKMRVNEASAQEIDDFLQRSATLTFEEFVDTYQPIRDNNDEPKQHTAQEVAASDARPEFIWTMLDCGTLVAGYHYVNRDHHLIATVPFTDDALHVPSDFEDEDSGEDEDDTPAPERPKRLTEFEHTVLVGLVAEYGIQAIRQRLDDIEEDDTPLEN